MVKKEAPKWQQIYAIPGMLISGTVTIVTQKLLYAQKSVGSSGAEREFRKPWFQTDMMFLGMMLSLIAYAVLGRREEKRSYESLDGERPATRSKIKFYLATALPACCDLAATSLSNIQLLYLNASVWQMLRGSMVIFSSLFCAFILKRPHFPYMWWSICGVVLALVVVGLAAVMSSGATVDGVSQSKTVFAIFLTIVAQLIQASQLVIEDFILHDWETHPLQLVGLKGMWGFILCTSIAMPIVQFTHQKEGNGLHEDIADTFKMIRNSTFILCFVIFYAVFILLYNVGGMLVINVYSAVHRTILEGFRTMFIWIVQLVIFYSTNNKTLGEKWSRWSFMQLTGFLLLFTCTLMYNKIIRLPVFKYPSDEKQNQGTNDGLESLLSEQERK